MARKKTGMISLEQGDIGYEIVDLGTGESRLIQTDWDFPGVAASFGWRACKCGRTDGTVDCPHKTASQMIGEAAEFLDEHIGDEIEDPGYFAGDDMAERRARSVSAGMDPFPNPGAAWHRRVATDRREWMEYAQDELADARARGDKQAIRRYEKMLAEYEGRTAEQEHSLMTSGDATEEEAYTQGIRPLVLGNPPFTKGHFDLIATVLRNTRPTPGTPKRDLWEDIVDSFENALAHTNPNFDSDKFFRWVKG